jgi:hypothetical protein
MIYKTSFGRGVQNQRNKETGNKITDKAVTI